MTRAQHTPGPWAVNPRVAQVDAFDQATPLPVCGLLWPTDERSEAETMANARLIAAAPELLQLLAGLIANVEFCRGAGRDLFEDLDLEPYSALVKRARGLS